jgi:hypothetical protein
MNKIIKRTAFSLAFMAAAIIMIPLTAQSEEQIAKFKQEREAYYTEKLELTEKESKGFWPLYSDFYNRKMKLVEDERNTFKYCHNNADNLTDQEFVEALEKIRKLKDEQHHLEQEYYHEKFPEVLPHKKVILLYKVEWDFRRHLLRKIRNHGDDNRGNRRSGRSGDGPGGGSGGSGEMSPTSPTSDSDAPGMAQPLQILR